MHEFKRENFLDVEELARYLGYANPAAMKNFMKEEPDTVFERKPYWRRETANELLEVKSRAIHAAFGKGGDRAESSDD